MRKTGGKWRKMRGNEKNRERGINSRKMGKKEGNGENAENEQGKWEKGKWGRGKTEKMRKMGRNQEKE